MKIVGARIYVIGPFAGVSMWHLGTYFPNLPANDMFFP
jgi:hypothetical protein